MKHTYGGEVQFKRYSDTSTQGQTVTFTLPSREDLESFIGLEGKRFQAVFVLIGDDEMPAEPPTRKEVGELCKWVAIRCTEPAFQHWVSEQNGRPTDQRTAAQWVRDTCGVTSRAHIDFNADAAEALHAKVRLPYAAWLKTQGITA